MYYRVLVASQRYHGQESLTYSSEQKLKVGQIIQVPLLNKPVLGIVESTSAKPSFNTKPIVASWNIAIPETSLRLMAWMKDYYPSPLGVLVELVTPPALPKKLPELPLASKTLPRQVELPPLTNDQQTVLDKIRNSKQQSFLLHGDTGSGKTRVYLELAREVIRNSRSALILTPEIGLTESLVQVFSAQFPGQVVITHSNMTPAERRNAWLRIVSSAAPVVVIGPRSALFSPIKKIGLIVVDEAHDTAYKQEQAPYYHATRVAGYLAGIHGSRLVLGSATPLVSDYFAFDQKHLPILRMGKPAINTHFKIETVIIDQRDKNQFTRSPWLSTPLLKAVEQALQNSEQSMLFLNRRGSARVIMCGNCGWQAMCPHCDVPLTFHQDQHAMRCHSCNFSQAPPSICPECGVSELVFRSIGTKALEVELQRIYPQAKISRFDRDTEKVARLENLHAELHQGDIDIIVGTQAIAKGFDLPKLSVVGIVNADSGLQIPDFTASERSFQLISQVSGRIGRGHRDSRLFVQSYQPESPLLHLALTKNYEVFLEQELLQRKNYKFPPYYFLLKITCNRASSKSAQNACANLAKQIYQANQKIIVEGPSPRFVEKVANRYGWHIIVKAKKRSILTDIAKNLPGNVTYDLDPTDLL